MKVIRGLALICLFASNAIIAEPEERHGFAKSPSENSCSHIVEILLAKVDEKDAQIKVLKYRTQNSKK